MNRKLYRLIFSPTLGMRIPAGETARSRGKAAGGVALLLTAAMLATPAQAELPVPCAGGSCGGGVPDFVTAGQANYHAHDHQAIVNQVGDKAILNWQSFNVSPGHSVQFQQVESLATENLVQGANFTTLNRVWDQDPSVIAGIITQAVGQNANVILVNTNGIAFMGSSQINLGSFTASSLDIADSFILNAFLTPQKTIPQFEGSGGFIKVFEGARITAESQGRVMLIAPTVINQGTVTAPDGQVIAAAGTKVFLRSASAQTADANVRGLLVEVDSPAGLADFDTANADVRDGKLDGQTVALKNATLDKLGHVTNLGELSTPRGNVTMVGYAVNQQGIARATTSVIANGSVYLLAKDGADAQDHSTRGGRALLGAGSLTQVLPDVSDPTGVPDGLTGPGLALLSQVRVVGQDVRMEGGAVIDAPAGEVNFFARDNPSVLFNQSTLGPDPVMQAVGAPISQTARIHIASGARISVAGLENVAVSAARNGVEVELRGDELKDSPVNRDGPLRGQKVFVDINRALANADAGKPTLIAKDSLQSYQARLERAVAERSTQGGTVSLSSQGEAIIESGAVIDLSGGSLHYTPASVPTTLVMSRGVVTDIANARADVRYDGIVTRYVQDFGRWNVQEVIDLGQSFNYDPGYTEGKNAGALEIVALRAAVMQGDVLGRITVGEVQRDLGIMPDGARLTVGMDPVANSLSGIDYKLNQMVELEGGNVLPAGFKFGDALPSGLVSTLRLDPALLGKDKVANLEIFSNQAAAVRESLRAPQGGSVHITAQGLTIGADIDAPAGSIVLDAQQNFNILSDPLNLVVADGVTLSARGAWVNDLRGVPAGSDDVARVDGGRIALSAPDNLVLGKNTLLDVTGGGRLRVDGRGKVIAGNGGEISLIGKAVSGLDGNVRGYGIGGGGALTVSSDRIQIGGTPDNAPGAANLDAALFEGAGFADIHLAGLESLVLSPGTRIRPAVLSLELQPDYLVRPSGSRVEDFTRPVKLDDLVRPPVNLSLTVENIGDGTGDLLIGAGARIEADPRANITLAAGRLLNIQGSISAPGGTITATTTTLDNKKDIPFDPANSLWLGRQAVLDVSGVALTYLDSQRLTQGTVLAGGAITLNAKAGYVVAEAGSSIRMAGAVPVRLDILNQTGGLGQWVGSDAGTLNIGAHEGVMLDGTLWAQAGGASNRGGVFSLALGNNLILDPINLGYPTGERIVSLAPSVAPQAGGLVPGSAIPAGLNGQARLGAAALEAAGFDRIALKSWDAIRLEDGLNLGAGRALPLQEVTLDAPRIEMSGGAGGNAALQAETVRLGNYDIERVSVANTPVAGSGTLKADARLLELAGNLTLSGMARAELSGAEEVRLAGVSSGDSPRPAGTLASAGDLLFSGAVVAPTTYSQFTIQAPGQTVTFGRHALPPSQPLSALGSLAVNAANIVQGGNIWAPFGQLAFSATDTLVFQDGSLTSIAAAPGSLIPFGTTVNGRSWTYNPDTFIIPLLALPGKSIRTQAASIDMQAGATFNLAGGGDLQAYEFSVGPGGSHDILGDPDTYAILPGYASAFAPGDGQENTGFGRAAGDAVYLSGIPGLPAGTYTLLPAHYALLPGAYAVRLDTSTPNLLPGMAFSRQDGIQVVPGYVTDSRAAAGGPRDALWSGFEVLTRDQVLQRSEMTLTRASDFFAASESRPQDAGLLSIATTGGLSLDAIFQLAAAEGGRGAPVDISAPRIAVTSGSPSGTLGIDPLATHIDVAKLDAMGAASLFLGGTRSPGNNRGDATLLTVEADEVTLANDAAHALKSGEIILAAKDTLTLKAGSAIETLGNAGGVSGGDAQSANRYETAGNGALVLAGSAPASFARTGGPDRSLGTLAGETGSTIRSGNTIILDATRQNAFAGTPLFADDKGSPAAGNLAIGAARINFGNAPAGAEGLTFSQNELDGLNSLNSLTLSSYSTFDLYGDVSVGGADASGKPTLQALNLQGAGLVGLDNSGRTATLRAINIVLSNPAAAAFAAGGTPGSGVLALQADTLVLGAGTKATQGFSRVDASANELVGRGAGATDIAAGAANLNVARISGEGGSDQTLSVSGPLQVAALAPDRALAAVAALGAKWALSGTEMLFDTQATLPSGQLALTAASGNLTLGAHAVADVAGRSVAFFDVSRAAPGGAVELASGNGNVALQSGARVDVSAAPGGDAGKVTIRAPRGGVDIAAGSLRGMAAADAGGVRGEGGRADLDVGTLADFSALNAALNQGGFDGAMALRVRGGDVVVAAADTVKAKEVRITVDSGKLDVAGHIDASDSAGGSIDLHAGSDVTLLPGARLDAYATGGGRNGGEVEIGTTSGRLNLASGSALDVRGGNGGDGAQPGEGGEVVLRAPRTGAGAGDEVAVGSAGGSIGGARSVVVEAVRVYDHIATLTGSGASSGTTLSLDTVNADNNSFATHAGAIAARLGKTGDPVFHVRAGVEVRSDAAVNGGDLALGNDWNLGASRAGGEPGMLTLRAAGNLNLNGNLSDGFNVATPFSSGTTPATLLAGDSWGYRLVAGADIDAADPLAVKPGAGDVTLAAGRLVRTGTGDIRIAAGGDITLADGKAAIYTAGRAADAVADFTVPANAQFSQGGGNVSLAAAGDIVGSPSAQLYSNWLFRQGKLNASTGVYTTQPAWWVRFDQFQQGIGALGGGNVTLAAGGNVENVSASTPTQARMAAAAPDAARLMKTGGGDVRVQAGGDLLGGQYYADRGELVLTAGGKVDSGQDANGGPLSTILALGDAQARVQARGDVTIQAVLNPHLVVQSGGSGGSFNLGTGLSGGVRDPRWSLFSTYGPDSGAQLQSLNGTVALSNDATMLVNSYNRAPLNFNVSAQAYNKELLSLLPPSLAMTAFQGDIGMLSSSTPAVMSPAARGDLSLLAAGTVSVRAPLVMSDKDPALVPDGVHPGTNTDDFPRSTVNPAFIAFLHGPVPVHTGDTQPACIYAVAGNVQGNFNELSLNLSKAVRVRAGQDVSDLGILVQHANASDLSQVVAGRDVVFTSGNDRSDNAEIWVGGPGRLEVTAGRNLDLGTSAGIVSRGDLDNAQLPAGGADIDLAAGVGAQGIDYAGTIARLAAALEKTGGSPDDALLWQARWLTGNNDLRGADALAAVTAVAALNADGQRAHVREMLYTALLVTGRDFNNPDSPFFKGYERGYAALELVFPGIGEKNADGSRNYQGEINLFASRVKTERGGHIEFMAPGGDVIVGLANTPAVLVNTGNDVLGMVAVADGSVRGFARGNILVNQSRILTLGGGNVLLWSSEGDIDAGKGKKSATAVPPPLVKVTASGQVIQELQGAASGSGIGALSTGGRKAGDIDLIAPTGTVNAGDAGIRANNLNIAAQAVLGAGNISVTGTSTGTPVADASAVSATTSGATSQGDDVAKTTAALSQNLSDAARAADEMRKIRPTFISSEVIGHGE